MANDLARGLFFALAGVNGLVLWHVLENSWRPVLGRRKDVAAPDAVPVPIPVAQLARECDVPKQRINDARRHLLDCGLLVASGEGYLISKAVESWVWPTGKNKGEPMLSPALIAYCQAAQRSKNTTTNQQTPGNGNPLPEGADGNEKPLPGTRRRNGKTLPPEAADSRPSNGKPLPQYRNSVTPVTEIRYPHIEERAPETSEIVLNGSGSGSNPPLPPTGKAEWMKLRATRPFKPPQAEVDQLVAWAETVADFLGGSIRGWAASYPTEWIRLAIQGAMAIDQSAVARYANKILIRFDQQGGPDPDPEPVEPRPAAERPAGYTPRARPARRTAEMIAAEQNAEDEERRRYNRERFGQPIRDGK